MKIHLIFLFTLICASNFLFGLTLINQSEKDIEVKYENTRNEWVKQTVQAKQTIHVDYNDDGLGLMCDVPYYSIWNAKNNSTITFLDNGGMLHQNPSRNTIKKAAITLSVTAVISGLVYLYKRHNNKRKNNE